MDLCGRRQTARDHISQHKRLLGSQGISPFATEHSPDSWQGDPPRGRWISPLPVPLVSATDSLRNHMLTEPFEEQPPKKRWGTIYKAILITVVVADGVCIDEDPTNILNTSYSEFDRSICFVVM